MRIQLILLFCIKTLLISPVFGQEEKDILDIEVKEEQLLDKKVKSPYGLRIGTDIAKLARTAIEKDYRGFELNADFRLSKHFYLAAALGNEKNTWDKDFLLADIEGNYAKIGLDYNAYKNWLGMNNSIFVGVRYGISNFKENLLSYRVYTKDQIFPTEIREVNELYKNLNMHWIEFRFGIKAELVKNLFLELHGSFQSSISKKEPENFGILYAPGFNRTYDNSSFGVGYGYTLSYLIPIFNK